MRIRIVKFLFIVFFVLLCACLYYLQIIKGPDFNDLSYRNSIRLLDIEAPRGIIYDRDKRIIVSNALSFDVFVVQQELEDFDREITALAELIGVQESLLRRNYKRNYRAPFAPCKVFDNLPKAKAILVQEFKQDMPGIIVRDIAVRSYPYKEPLAHVSGYIGEIDGRELEFLQSYGYSAKDLIGKDGIEKFADSFLRGKNGGMQIQVDNRGRQVKVLNRKKSRRGRDVILTVDSEFQNFVWKMLKGQVGAAVFMDVHTGEILSLVSTPSFDPNESIAKVFGKQDSPLVNKVIAGRYPPGSLFKIFVSLAGLEIRKIEKDTSFVCKGKLNIGGTIFHCWDRDGHGVMIVKKAIIESCNVFFYNVGMLIGADRISEYAKIFGFGKRTGIELSGESEGLVSSKAWKRLERQEAWYTGDTVNFSIGQGYLLVTPLQMACAMACVANGGYLVAPHIIKKIGDVEIKGHKKIKMKIKDDYFRLVRDAMRGVVTDINGTGSRAQSNYISISGKTGTSQSGSDLRPHAWFGGFAPYENPEISFVVFIEHGGSGGDMPALIVKKALEYWVSKKQARQFLNP